MRSPTGWTYRVALNELRRQLRRQGRERELLQTVGAFEGMQDSYMWLEVMEAVRHLTTRQRTVLALLYIADLPQQEVARLMRVSRGTVASTLADAKAAVRNHESTLPGKVVRENCRGRY